MHTEFPEMSAYNVLTGYDSKREDLCVVTKKGGRKYLSTIDKEEVNSLGNRILKAFGMGILTRIDTSITGVEEYLAELFLSDEDSEEVNELKTMTSDSPAYKTTDKIAKLAGEKGFHALENVMKVQKIYPKLSSEQQSKTSLRDLMLIVRDGGNFETIEDLRGFVELLKMRKKLEKEIHALEIDSETVLPDNDRLKKEIDQSVADLKRRLQTTKQAIFVQKYGSKEAKKLPFEDLQLLFKNKRSQYISDEEKSEAELKQLVDSLRPKTSLQEAVDAPEEVVEEPTDLFIDSKQEQLKAMFQTYEVSEDVRKNLTGEEFELLIKNGFESRLNPEASLEDLKKIVNLLNDLEEVDLFLEELGSERNEIIDEEVNIEQFAKRDKNLEDIENVKLLKEELLEEIEWAKYDISDQVKANISLKECQLLFKHGFKSKINPEATVDDLKKNIKLLDELEETNSLIESFTAKNETLKYSDKIHALKNIRRDLLLNIEIAKYDVSGQREHIKAQERELFEVLYDIPKDISAELSSEDIRLILEYDQQSEIKAIAKEDVRTFVNALRAKDALIQVHNDVSDTLKKELSLEELQLILKHGFESKMDRYATSVGLKELAQLLKNFEDTKTRLEDAENKASVALEESNSLDFDVLEANEQEIIRLKALLKDYQNQIDAKRD